MSGGAHVAKHALFVEPTPGVLDAVRAVFEAEGFEAHGVATSEAAWQRANQTPLLSMVVLHDGLGGDEGAALIGRLKEAHRELPVLWLTSQLAAAPLSVNAYAPDAILPLAPDQDLVSRVASRLLMLRRYPPELVDALGHATSTVLAEAYAIRVAVTGTHVRANRSVLGAVSVMLPFCGPHISGRVVVGAEEDALLSIHEQAVGGGQATRREAEDLAGEMANLIVGRAKSLFCHHGLDFELGTPLVMEANGTQSDYRSSRPGLVLTLDDAGAQQLRVAFAFDEYDAERLDGIGDHVEDDEDGDELAGGELLFF